MPTSQPITPKRKKSIPPPRAKHFSLLRIGILCFAFFLLVHFLGYTNLFTVEYSKADVAATSTIATSTLPTVPTRPPLDTADYDRRMLLLANNPASKIASSTTASSTPARAPTVFPWPTKTVYPNAGALLPFNRIVAYYGNFYSKGMGVLGQYPEKVMLEKLKGEVATWQQADPNTPVIPAIHYIVATAQGSPGVAGKYRLRMPDDQIEKAIKLADQVHGVVFLDVQIGLSDLPAELVILEKYLKLPQVHLGIDPEFSMKTGAKPGSVIGTMDASDVNYAANYLARLVKANNLPPKMLIVHRFTIPMVTHYRQIKPLPEVQIVMDMDGWGFPAKKLNTYKLVVTQEPIQFAGIKLFYKNDLRPPSPALLTPKEILNLNPRPIYIQYQ